MSVEELDTIGKTFALTVQSRLHFQAISFYVFEREDGQGHFAGGMMTHEGDDEKEYIIGSARIPRVFNAHNGHGAGPARRPDQWQGAHTLWAGVGLLVLLAKLRTGNVRV